MPQIITKDKLKQLVEQLQKDGKTVAGTVAGKQRPYFSKIIKGNELYLDAEQMPANSVKNFLFPRHESIFRYRYEGQERVIEDAEPFAEEQIIFGVRPCDAASLPILDHVFSWDFQDRFYQQRRANTTIVTLACSVADENCFCTSVNLSPDTTSGADAMLVPIDAETFEVRIVTDKGAALFTGQTVESDKTGHTATPPPIRFDKNKVGQYLKEHFGGQIFDDSSLRCVGCGACTYICPTCHCFDIVDEGGAAKGVRVKNWDSCQFALFTLHASGHNPRSHQALRQHNRISHKFNIYPQKFGTILCTGCGNCTRICAASLGVRPVLEQISNQVPAGNGQVQ